MIQISQEEFLILEKFSATFIKQSIVKSALLETLDLKKEALQNTITLASRVLEELKDKNNQSWLMEAYESFLDQESFFEKDSKVFCHTLLRLFNSISNTLIAIQSFPLHDGDMHGTVHAQSSLKALIKTELNYFENMLFRKHHTIVTEAERSIKTKSYKLTKNVSKNEHYFIMELVNLGFMHNFDIESIIGDSESFLTIEQTSAFFNGKKCTKSELIKSSMLVSLSILKKPSLPMEDKRRIVDFIMALHMLFFNDFFNSNEKDKKRNSLIITPQYFNKDIYLKTLFKRIVPIFTTHKKSNILENIDEEEFFKKDILFVKMMIRYMKRHNFNQKERRVIFTFLSNYLQGNFPIA